MNAKRIRTFYRQFPTALGVLTTLAACSSGSTISEPDEPGAISGEFVTYIADFDDGTTETRYMLRDAAGVETKLLFHVEPKIEPGSRLTRQAPRRWYGRVQLPHRGG